MTKPYLLTLSCANRPGIVTRVTDVMYRHGGDIKEAHQYDDAETGRFFGRIVLSLPDEAAADDLRAGIAPLAEELALDWTLRPKDELRKVLILVSKFDHCLVDLLYRNRIGELPMDVVGIISNHPLGTYQGVDFGGIPFHHLPITKETKPQQEARIKAIVDETGAELIVLARYMQILSPELCRFLEGRAINIHHSFLPSFKGARPYHQAHERGVKLIGATAHYVTSDLDEGPIVEQDVARIDHSMTPDQLVAIGRDVECVTLARAIQWHAEHRVLLNGHRTVVFR